MAAQWPSAALSTPHRRTPDKLRHSPGYPACLSIGIAGPCDALHQNIFFLLPCISQTTPSTQYNIPENWHQPATERQQHAAGRSSNPITAGSFPLCRARQYLSPDTALSSKSVLDVHRECEYTRACVRKSEKESEGEVSETRKYKKSVRVSESDMMRKRRATR